MFMSVVVARIHAAGLKAGVHLFGPSVAPNDPYVLSRELVDHLFTHLLTEEEYAFLADTMLGQKILCDPCAALTR